MASFSKYIPKLEASEGGFQNNPKDNGNYNSLGDMAGTNFGISARFYENVIGRPPTEYDMRNLTKPRAQQIMKQYFWDANLGDQINSQAIADTVIDHQINSGRGIKLAQKLLNNSFGFSLAKDGVMGAKTLAAINSVNAKSFTAKYNDSREVYYQDLNQSTFIDGWIGRLRKFAYGHQTAISASAVVVVGVVAFISYKLINQA